MAKDLNIYELIKKNFKLNDINIDMYSPLVLAYIGDAIFEIIIRTILTSNYINKVSNLNNRCSKIVQATTQAKMARLLLENDILSNNEKSIYKRGRNANSHTHAKNSSMSDYKMSTGFEALLGYLYLNNEHERLMEIIDTALCLAQVNKIIMPKMEK